MTFQERWQRLPQWFQVTVYTVLGIAAIGGVGYLGFQLIRVMIGAEQMNVFWGCAGSVALIGIVFGGLHSGRHAGNRRRRGEAAD
ncbi:MAG TPA: hypothetical protein PKU80_02685 [Candidatus Limiplasma sp.]|nr:hypothetical protein [Candidatus Limiplasma sp.]HRX08150.1 hypothetical protein [Candidatus Limiplasma sp.]